MQRGDSITPELKSPSKDTPDFVADKRVSSAVGAPSDPRYSQSPNTTDDATGEVELAFRNSPQNKPSTSIPQNNGSPTNNLRQYSQNEAIAQNFRPNKKQGLHSALPRGSKMMNDGPSRQKSEEPGDLSSMGALNNLDIN